MNIWILNHYADSPEGQYTRDYDRGRYLVEQGHQVTVFSAAFNHYTLHDDKLAPGQGHRVEEYNGVRFVWVRTLQYKKNNWRRMANMASFTWRAYWIGRRMKERPDVVIGTSTHLLAPLAAYGVAKAKRARFFLVITDLWPQTLVDMGTLSQHSPITWGLRRLEKFLYRRAEKIFTVLPHADEYIGGLGIPREKVVWIPNGVDLRHFAAIKSYQGGDSSSFTFMYTGGHAPHLGLDVILEAAKIVQDAGESQVRFVLVGEGIEKPRLMERAKKLGLLNTEFRNAVPKRELYKVLGEADALLCHFRDLPILRFGSSLLKLFDYMASGRPIIYAVNGPQNLVEEAQAGIAIPAEDPQAMAQAIRRLMAMSPQERLQMGRNGYSCVKAGYDTRVLAARMESMLQSPVIAKVGKQ